MKILFSLVCTTVLLFCAPIVHAQESLKGVWTMEQENTKIEIKEKDGQYEGRIVASDNKKAPIGNLILKEVKPSGTQYTGKLYAPKRGQWFDATLQPKGDKILVTVKAGPKSKTVEWTKD
ncbi:DUF2147 domain-containing protein [bacterium]|nr:DUF2147 domain-containing protein [bacterium]